MAEDSRENNYCYERSMHRQRKPGNLSLRGDPGTMKKKDHHGLTN